MTTKKNRSNLDSPRTLASPCDLHDLQRWVQNEIGTIDEIPMRTVVSDVCRSIDAWVRLPREAVLLWQGCVRGGNTKYHTYPVNLKQHLKSLKITEDGRANGPAITAFAVAGGERPSRYGSQNAWSIHHLYSGKFPYPGHTDTFHAVKEERHFSQSAGLVAIHPVADALCDEYPCVAWLLRAKAFLQFGYDPDAAFSQERHDEHGFVSGKSPQVLHMGQPPESDPALFR